MVSNNYSTLLWGILWANFFIAIFAGYIRYDFEISHTTWGSIYALGTCLSTALMFKLGEITEKFKSVNLVL